MYIEYTKDITNMNKTKHTTIRLSDEEKQQAKEYLKKHSWIGNFTALVRYALAELFAKDKGQTK